MNENPYQSPQADDSLKAEGDPDAVRSFHPSDRSWRDLVSLLSIGGGIGALIALTAVFLARQYR